jgi:hypothetical protein
MRLRSYSLALTSSPLAMCYALTLTPAQNSLNLSPGVC